MPRKHTVGNLALAGYEDIFTSHLAPMEGGYELIAGNRRKRACELAGLSAMPVIVRDLDDDSAAIAMAAIVDNSAMEGML
jgi:Predicted transcriptional regulators